MRFLIQRVSRASVSVDGACVGAIDKGFLVLIGISHTDDRAVADKMVKKLCGLRIFEDAQGKTNLAPADVGGNLLLISQFTLYADCKHGYRPSFTNAAGPAEAEALYEYVLAACRERFPALACGRFGADMKVELCNEGPFTVLLDSAEL